MSLSAVRASLGHGSDRSSKTKVAILSVSRCQSASEIKLRNGDFVMKWTKVPFGKYAGKTLPQIAFIDPDWLFWLIKKADLYGPLAREAKAVIERCATHIRC